jgi:site-specific recombinase XerD
VLYGPTTAHGAKRRPKLKRYIWYVEWYDEAGTRREHSLRVERGDDYTGALESFLAGRREVPAESELISDVLVRYWNDHGQHTISAQSLGSAVKRLLESFDGKTLADLSEQLCRDYERSRPSRGTARTELTILSAAIKHGADRGKNSYAKVWRPDPPPGRDRLMTRDEYARIIRYWRREVKKGDVAVRVVRQHRTYCIILRLLISTGARLNSIVTLGFKPRTGGGHIDLARGVIVLNPHGRSKTKKEKPTIPIPRHLIPALKRAHARNNEHLCVGRHGKPISMWAFEQAWRKACAELKIVGTSPHCVKHTTVTDLVDEKQDLALISRLTGTTPGTLLKKYTHLRPQSVEHLTRRRRPRPLEQQ